MPERIQRKRTKGWKMPENTVYVGRGSKWGNPFKVGHFYFEKYYPNFASRCLTSEKKENVFFNEITARAAVYLFEKYALMKIDTKDLRGKNLACWCPLDQPCHADVLLRKANEDEKQ